MSLNESAITAMATHARTEDQPDVEQGGQRTDRLSIFREAVGITDVMPLMHGEKRRTANNVGVYKRIVDAERGARHQYYSVACLINACLLLQIIFASALTALGASGSSHVTITIFGALNTVIAGLLSFTKGQGLPNRHRQYQNTLRKVREYIEQREREFGQLDCMNDLQEEIKTIVTMYNSARENDENNDPSVYQPPAGPPRTHKLFAASEPEQPSFASANLEQLTSKLAGHSKDYSDEFEGPRRADTQGMAADNVRVRP